MRRRRTEKIFNLLFEAEETPESPVNTRDPEVRARPAEDSVDDQIDALILRYENASIKETTSLSESLTELNLKYLFEQDDDLGLDDLPEEGGEEDTAGEEDTGESEDPKGSEAMSVTEPAEDQGIPPLDIDAFSSRVVRLIMNYNNLLSVEDAIINRTKNFLDENYGDKFVNKFLEILDNQYGLSAKESKVEYPPDDETFGLGANPAGAGITGGA